jgi:GAF domain-containing protein
MRRDPETAVPRKAHWPSFAEMQARIRALEAETDALKAELRQAGDQQTATAEVLQVINSSPGDLAPVFEAMLDKAMHLCGAAFGNLFTYDGELFHTAAHHGEPAYGDWLRQASPVHPERAVTFRRILGGAALVHIADVLDDDAYRNVDPDARTAVEASRMRTLLSVPLRKDTTLLGVIAIYRQEVRPFTDKQIALLQNFAAQAVIAMENARLITETREALEQQTATAEVLQVINSSPGDLAPVFEAILEKAHSLCEASSGGLVLIEGSQYRAIAVHGDPEVSEYWLQQGWVPFGPGVPEGLSRGEVAHVLDATAEESIQNRGEQYRRLIELSGARSLLIVPLLKDGVLSGAITAFRKEVRPFTDKQVALLQNFAAQAVIAMENARLITETREALEQQTATAEVLGVINTSPGNLGPVFDAMLEKAMHLCEGAFGGLWVFEGDRYVATALRGVPEPYAEFLSRTTVIPGPGSAPYRFLHGERSVIQNIDLLTSRQVRRQLC